MKLFSGDELVLFGPGSEWFWAALSGIATAVTLLAILRQLRIQASQAAIEQVASFDREWMSERFVTYRLDVYLALQSGTNLANLPQPATTRLGDYWESIGALVRKGHLDRRLLRESNGPLCEIAWMYLGPNAEAERAKWNDPTIGIHFEWLAGVMGEMHRAQAVDAKTFDLAEFMSGLDGWIASLRRSLAIEQSLRSVTIAPSNAPAMPPSAATPVVAPVPAEG